jgi:hypothetical protein
LALRADTDQPAVYTLFRSSPDLLGTQIRTAFPERGTCVNADFVSFEILFRDVEYRSQIAEIQDHPPIHFVYLRPDFRHDQFFSRFGFHQLSQTFASSSSDVRRAWCVG